MHLFSHAEQLTVMEWTLRACIAYIFLLFMAKVMGQRSIAQLRFLDVVLALLLEGNLSNPLSDEHVDLTGPLITSFVLVFLHWGSVMISLRFEWWRNFLEPEPFLLVHNGKIQWKNLKKARISIDYLLSELRRQNMESVENVAIALWEPGGHISSFLKTEFSPLTKKDGNVNITPFSMPLIVMKEGNVRKEALLSLGKSEEWLTNQIGEENLPNILLAMADSNGKLELIFKNSV